MAPNPRVAKAFRAMKDIGVTEEIAKPVLKNLLKVYQKNWNFIEEDNYRALVDAIFEKDEGEVPQPENKNQNADAQAMETRKKRRNADPEEANDKADGHEQPDRPLKRLRLRYQEDHVPTSPSSSNPRLCSNSKNLQVQNEENSLALLKPKDEPPSDDLPLEVSIPVPLCSEQVLGRSNLIRDVEVPKTPPFNSANVKERNNGANIIFDSSSELQIASVASGEVKISMSLIHPQGSPDFRLPIIDELFKRTEEKCLRSHKFLDPSFSVREILNELCACALELGTPPSKESQEATNVLSSDEMPDKSTPAVVEVVAKEPLISTRYVGIPDVAEVVQSLYLPRTSNGIGQSPQSANGLTGKEKGVNKDKKQKDLEKNQICPRGYVNIPDVVKVQQSKALYLPPTSNRIGQSPQSANGLTGKRGDTVKYNEQNGIEKNNSYSLMVVENLAMMPVEIQAPIHAVDISKGLESIKISLVNDVNDDPPPAFHYIPSNIKFENASFSFSLARIGDSYCSTCIRDCASTPCACGHGTSGVAYTIEGLIKEIFLEECMSMNHNSRKYSLSYCKDCPLERSKENAKEGCKGHLVRKFIKECWWKCGCNGGCGNRVVQHGIKRSLQVFMTSQGKGWGLRTLEELPKGVFVCEFVGEVLTNKELYSRISKSSRKHEFPVMLDADWSARSIKDDEALCLDAMYYGNVARFINHRCFDANLIGIPVEVDTPERHYYRFAFFTTRNVDALEELTRDYGIDFDDHGNEFKTFECLCESKFCRNLRRMTRSRSGKSGSGSRPAKRRR